MVGIAAEAVGTDEVGLGILVLVLFDLRWCFAILVGGGQR